MTDDTKHKVLPAAETLAVFAAEASEAVVEGQRAVLAVLGAELQGLADQFAGGHRSQADLNRIEAEVEAGFDDMPV